MKKGVAPSAIDGKAIDETLSVVVNSEFTPKELKQILYGVRSTVFQSGPRII